MEGKGGAMISDVIEFNVGPPMASIWD